MDVRIDGLHEKALVKLMEANHEKTAVAMTRLLIREAARVAGVWPADEPKAEQLVTVPTTQ